MTKKGILGSFIDYEETFYEPEQLEAFQKYFLTLNIGSIIPPSEFQNWLHPDLKQRHTKIPEGYPDNWLEMT